MLVLSLSLSQVCRLLARQWERDTTKKHREKRLTTGLWQCRVTMTRTSLMGHMEHSACAFVSFASFRYFAHSLSHLMRQALSASATLGLWGGGGGGYRGATHVLMIFPQPSLSSASLRVLARGSSIYSLMLSCQHFFGLLRLLPPGPVPCMMVLVSPAARVTSPHHLSFLLLTMEMRSSCGPMAALTRFLTSSFVILSLNEMPKIFL